MNFVRLWLRRLPIDYIIFLLLEMNRILGYKALIITKTKKKRKKIYIKKNGNIPNKWKSKENQCFENFV